MLYLLRKLRTLKVVVMGVAVGGAGEGSKILTFSRFLVRLEWQDKIWKRFVYIVIFENLR